MKNLIFFLFAFLLLSSCSREYYKTAGYDQYAPGHHLIAVVPVHTITTGRIPPEVTGEMIEQLENAESQAFQISLYNEIARRSGSRAGEIQINLQHYTETNARLKEAGYTPRESLELPPAELAQILGVDAVVRATVRKTQYLTDLEAFGLDMATTFLAIFTDWPFWFIPDSKTADVDASCSILDGTTGIPVWSTNRRWRLDWNRRHNEIIDNISRKMARRFPYRESWDR
ncbi:MAG: hypothetical protein KDD06_22720 [Phaeodactylibacter sp.]|nr:hypothetical protein [Phaeodactylibacter sp.]MCB9265462.1 hypothetical protein [Lewinellaceae bacterium]MCB9289602.1 hypothetical protein [Lewinellaceae bacterium]